ncbi:dTDP-4-dehydrorhamnose reductase [Salinivibrio kushneri]|uniref:dTDP-4-dehydrorhamnose reductase n=1 Tax=Salinivibrio kushneri TaxID=1908198 RepID=A0AB36JUK9_9GAMM|nr:dTDP-4-dehydrorhamnose reductase [Salinivibrio kushneri]OOE39318.1 dTDP-4-dehydrorhamnose reductase [Salinivibrio kushneri]QCP02450.1 dTDP-4-dehydrorhamnose reductase [Salinivibrio kushneri]
MRILITGSQGQVGHCLVEQLRGNEQVTILACDRHQLDITDRTAVLNKVSEFKPTVIINAAAYTAVDGAESDRDLAYAINQKGAKYLADAAEQQGAALLHISTDYVFAGDKEGAYHEQDCPESQSVYGASKLAGEQAIQTACSKHIIIRTAWVFGEHGGNFVKTMLRLASQRDALSIVDDQVCGPTYAGDLAKALIYIAQCIDAGNDVAYGVYHFAGEPHVSWCEFASTIFTRAHEQGVLKTTPTVTPISTAEYPTPATRPANSRLNTSKIMTHFSIPASDWQHALGNLIRYQD